MLVMEFVNSMGVLITSCLWLAMAEMKWLSSRSRPIVPCIRLFDKLSSGQSNAAQPNGDSYIRLSNGSNRGVTTYG